MAFDYIIAKGHINIRGTHPTTFEITKERELTPRGDCIIGVNSSKSASELSTDLKRVIQKDNSMIIIILSTKKYNDVVIGEGSSLLKLDDPTRVIVRRSNYINGATIAIRANKAALNLDRNLIRDLKDGSEITVFLIGISLD